MSKIQSFWYGNTISTMEKLCISSFLRNGHTVDIYAYEEVIGLPAGANLIDANSILDRGLVFFDSSGSIAAFSDWFRYKLLFDKGSWWVDMDVICLKPFDIADDFCFATENFSSNYETGITCCVIKSLAGAEFLKIILDHINTYETNTNIIWGQFGPGLINAVLKQFDSISYVQPVEAFCPVDWTDMKTLTSEGKQLPKESFAIHMWSNLWRLNHLDKDSSYESKSIYEQLKRKYLANS